METKKFKSWIGKDISKEKTKVIHKRMDTINICFGAKAKCGLSEFYIKEENLNWRWNKVTCKSCLRLK